MKKLFVTLSLLILLILCTQSVFAATILLSDGGWVFSNSDTSAKKIFSVSGVNLGVEIESYAYDSVNWTSQTSRLSHVVGSGFGVISDAGVTDLLDSSSSGHEILTVTFDKSVNVSGYGMSDWSTGKGFTPKVYNFSPYAEIYLPMIGGSIDSNGFMSFSFPGKPLAKGDFLRDFVMGVGTDGLRWARLDVTVNGSPVPVPSAFWLLGSGLIGLTGFSRRKR